MEHMLQMLMGDQGRGNDFELVSGWIDEIIGGHEGAQVAASLREEMVDVEALAEFSEHDLLKYGVSREGFRKKLVRPECLNVAGSKAWAGSFCSCSHWFYQ